METDYGSAADFLYFYATVRLPKLLVALGQLSPFLFAPDLRPHTRVVGLGDISARTFPRKGGGVRGARMLRTALGPAIAKWLTDPAVVEVMLNPDGRLWVDRLSEGLVDTGAQLSAADGERIVKSSPIMSGRRCTLARPASQRPCWVWLLPSGPENV